jgi:hypothetical protein
MSNINFTIETLNDNGSGMEYHTKEDFLKEISLMVDDAIANGATFFDIQVDSDASCFEKEDEDEEEDYEDEDCEDEEEE